MRLDQSNLLCARPTLDPFLGFDCLLRRWKDIVIDQQVDVVFRGKAWNQFLLVLPRAAIQVVRHPHVKDSRPACEDVDVELTHVRSR